MSNSPLAFLTLLEECLRPLAPEPVTAGWRFQRLVDFRGRSAVLQLWEDKAPVAGMAADPAASATLLGRAEVKELRDERSAPFLTGAVHGAPGEPAQTFAFAPSGAEETARQIRRIAEQWKRVLRLPEIAAE